MSKHTPGPWKRAREGEYGYSTLTIAISPIPDEAVSIAEVYGETQEETEANADLMAAAPVLLAALSRALPLLRLLAVRQVIEAGDDAITAAGLNPYAMNEGLAEGHERLSLWWVEAAIAQAEGRKP